MQKNTKENKKIFISGLIMIIILSGAFSIKEYYAITRRYNIIISYHTAITSYQDKINAILSKNHAPLGIDNISLIDTWMTFNYINTIFKLPSDYLKTNLNISDLHYPNLSLNSYIRNQKLDKTVFLESVRTAVSDYLTK